MGLKELNPKKCWDSDEDDILNDFYIPALTESKKYYRLAGYFNSNSLFVAARGISRLINNNGEMKLICEAQLSSEDIQAIKNAEKNPEEVISNNILKDLTNLQQAIVKDHLSALGWMIAEKKLQIKVAVVKNKNYVNRSSIFHQKIGILEDDSGDIISFSGSDNESASALLSNVEEFKVFRSWDKYQLEYLEGDKKRFFKFWNDKANKTNVFDIPTAVKKELIKIKPDNISNLDLEKWYSKNKKRIKLYEYQKTALNSWINNDKQGLFEMATGTGKTFTALGCLKKCIDEENQIVVIISCPFSHLIEQWDEEIQKFGINEDIIIADSTNVKWKDEISDYLTDIQNILKNKLIVLTTHRTFSSSNFIYILKRFKKDNNIPIITIVDEVHGIGAEKSRGGLLEEYEYRLGLSATPKRWLDFIGTDKIYDYFNKVVYKFPLKKAINNINPRTNKTYLTPFKFIPKFITLNKNELEKYMKITRAFISKNMNKKDEQKIPGIENLLFLRANIVKDAQQKYSMLEEILDGLGDNLKYTIIYCSPNQIKEVTDILNQRDIVSSPFTMEQGTKPKKIYNEKSERKHILSEFEKGYFQVLVAMKCLDEGVDIPPARIAIFLSSSGNPREYIQRIGRVLRRSKGKEESLIYDIIVKPNSDLKSEYKKIEENIFINELERYFEIADAAKNKAEVFEKLIIERDKL